jgi:hypothetical protein
MYKIQIASTIYLTQLNTIKKILDLLQLKFGKESDDFKYLKKEIFDYFYNDMKKLFIKLESEKIIKKCPSGCSIRQGYTQCEHCNGSGYTNI